MPDVIHELESPCLTTIPLSWALQDADPRFREAVIGALLQEGFELDDPFLCLQHPLEVLEAIQWLETLDFGPPWQAFRQLLLAAGKAGILMDMNTHRPTRSGCAAEPPQPGLEIA